jgi:hypothetical protein
MPRLARPVNMGAPANRVSKAAARPWPPSGAASLVVARLYLVLATSIFFADVFCSVFSPMEMVRMPSR